jgi:RimJ/RimL family protein N-acetyltransferase
MRIETARLMISFIGEKAEDLKPAEVLSIINSNPDFIDQSEGPVGKRAYTLEEIDKSRRENWREHLRVFAMRLKESGQLIGYGDVLAPHPKGRWAAIGLLVLHRNWQSAGFGREAVSAIDAMLSSEGWPEVEVVVFHERPRSRRFWESCGFRFERDTIAENGHLCWLLRKSLAP